MSHGKFLILAAIDEYAFDNFQHLQHGFTGHSLRRAAQVKTELIETSANLSQSLANSL